MKTIEILVGIPCSGKSTYSTKEWYNNTHTQVLSRDNIRESQFGKDYKQNRQDEMTISIIFNNKICEYLNSNYCDKLILDNTHCKESYIDNIIDHYSDNDNIRIVFFNISLLKAHYRNIHRY